MEETILLELRTVAETVGLEVLDEGSTAFGYVVLGSYDSKKLKLWYDTEKKLYGFDLWTGGSKSYATLQEFESNLKTYMWINTKFIPVAKRLAASFDSLLGINSAYESFRGSDGCFTAFFRVLGEDDGQSVCVELSDNDGCYAVKLLQFIEGGAKCRTKLSLWYNEQEEVVWTLESARKALLLQQDFECEADSFGRVSFSFCGIKYHLNLAVMDDKLVWVYNDCKYMVKDPCGFAFDMVKELVHGSDSWAEGLRKIVEEDVKQEDNPVDEGLDEEEQVPEDVEQDAKLEAEGRKEAEEPIPEELPTEEDSDGVDVPESEEEVAKEADESFLVMKLVADTPDNVLGLHVVADGVLYRLSLDRVNSLGFPLSRVKPVDGLVLRCGVYMTAMEQQLKCFAKDISDDEALCKTIIDRVFAQ